MLIGETISSKMLATGHRDDAGEFMQRWYDRGMAHLHPHDRFFSLWLCLLVAAQDTWPAGRARNERGDWSLVESYFERNADDVCRGVNDATQARDFLARRTGTRTGGPIIDVPSEEARDGMEKLARQWRGGEALTPAREARLTSHVLLRVRNNLFHGMKVEEDDADRALLDAVNELMASVLRAVEPKALVS
jgi:hypothetical protein